MRRIIAFFVLVVLAIAAVLFVRDHPGQVQVEWFDYRIETDIGYAIVALILLMIAVVLLVQLLLLVLFSPHKIARWFSRRRQRKGLQALSLGMVAVAAGDSEEAGRQSRRASHMLTGVPLSNLLSAQAAQLRGDEAAAHRYFEAMLDDPQTEFLGLRGLLMQALRLHDDGRALRLALRARELRPKSPWLLQTLAELQTRSGAWEEALATTASARRIGAIDDGEAKRRAAIIEAQASRATETAGDAEQALHYARHAHKAAPDFVPAALQLAHLHAARGDTRRAADVLSRAWSRSPHPDLAAAFRRLYPAEPPAKMYKRLTALTKSAPDSTESRLVLAAAAVEAGNFDDARTLLDGVDDAVGGARRYRMLAEIEERQGGDMAAARGWLAKAAAFGRQQAWICTDCGAAAADWTADCTSCGAFGTLEWRNFGPDEAMVLDDGLPPAGRPQIGASGSAHTDGPHAGGVDTDGVDTETGADPQAANRAESDTEGAGAPGSTERGVASP